MRIALIRSGLVADVILSDMAFAQSLGADAVVDVTDRPRVQPGDAYADGVFTPKPFDQTVVVKADIEARAERAIEDLRAYRGLATPSNAQTIAVIKLLCLVVIGLIRLNLHKFDQAE